jgi:hypothetical protein
VIRVYFQRVSQFIILIWNRIRNKPSPDAIVDEQLAHTPDEQTTRIKRRLQEHREREEKV